DLGQGLDSPPANPADSDIAEHGSGRQIIVPETMVNALKMPDALACLRIQADQALGEEIVAETVPSVPVIGRSPRWNVDITEFIIGAKQCPGICVASVFPRLLLPCFVSELASLGNSMK